MHPNALEPAAYVSRLADASRRLIPHLSAGEKLGRRIVNKAMEEATGCTSASGVWSQRDSFQMLEMAVLRWLAEQSIPSSAEQALSFLHSLEARLPTQTVRSEEQVEHQHFSTPLGLAWLSAHLADIQPDDAVLEPSAGTGMLAVWATRPILGSAVMVSGGAIRARIYTAADVHEDVDVVRVAGDDILHFFPGAIPAMAFSDDMREELAAPVRPLFAVEPYGWQFGLVTTPMHLPFLQPKM